MSDDFEIDEKLKARATVELPEVPALTPDELPNELAAGLLWELAYESISTALWASRHEIEARVFRSDIVLSARLGKAEWTTDRQGHRRWIPSSGVVVIGLRGMEDAEAGTIRDYTSRFSGPVSREEFLEHVVGLMVDLKQKYVVSELKKFKS